MNRSPDRQQRLDRVLVHAAVRGNASRVERLLDMGASVDAVDAWGLTALGHAGRSHMSNAATVQVLLDRGASIKPKTGQTDPFLLSCHKSDDDRIRLLLEHGADPNSHDPSFLRGNTALMELVCWARPETISLMLAHGADVNGRCSHLGITALHFAAFMGRLDIVKLLLARGADLFATDNRGWNAIDHIKDNLREGAYAYSKHPDWSKPQKATLAWIKEEMTRRRSPVDE
jgi:uncharacterized protein